MDMVRCIAITLKNEQCKRERNDGCYGLCQRHWNAFTPQQKKLAKDIAESKKTNETLMSRVKKAGKYVHFVLNTAEYLFLVYEIYKAVGPIVGGSAGQFSKKLSANDKKTAFRQVEALTGMKLTAPRSHAARRVAQKKQLQAVVKKLSARKVAFRA
jgi:hypothetical protein